MTRPSITVTGLRFSKVSTLARELAEKLKLKYENTGSILGQRERRDGNSPFASYKHNQPYYDRQRVDLTKLDERIVQIIQYGNVVVDTNYAGLISKLRRLPTFNVFVGGSLNSRIQNMRPNGFLDTSADVLADILRENDRERDARSIEQYGVSYESEDLYHVFFENNSQSTEDRLGIVLIEMHEHGIKV